VERVVFFNLSGVTLKIYYIMFAALPNGIPQITFDRQTEH